MDINTVKELQNSISIKISELESADNKDYELISKLKSQIIDLEFDLFMGKNTDK